MLLVLTGPSCSGKSTLANRVLHTSDARLLNLSSTECETLGTTHITVTDSTFDSVADMLVLRNDDTCRSGISRSELCLAVADVDKIVVITCNVQEALALARIAPGLNTPSICAFLHCKPIELIRRLHSKQRLNRLDEETCYRSICEIYEDHNSNFIQLEDLSLSGNGFTSVLPINTGKAPAVNYQALVVDPLMAVLDSLSVYKNMRKMRFQQNTSLLEVLKHANQ